MKKKSSYRWLIWIILAVVLIGVALWNILPRTLIDGNLPEIMTNLLKSI